MKKTIICLGLVGVMGVAYADDEPVTPDTHQIVTSQYYVDTTLATKQKKIGSGGDGGTGDDGDIVTYGNAAGKVGAKKVYNESGTYNTQTDRLVQAETVNNGIKKGLNEHLSCAGNNPSTNTCWLYQINTMTGTYLNQGNN